MGIFLGIIVFLLIAVPGYLFIFCFRIVPPNKRAIKIFLGHPGKTVESGPTFVFAPLQWLQMASTETIEMEMRPAIVFTKKEGEYESARVEVTPSVFLELPDNLLAPLKRLGDMDDREKLKDLLEEPVLEAVRIEGGKMTWRQITDEQIKYARQIKKILFNHTTDPMRKLGIDKAKVAIVLTNVKLPEELSKAINEPEVARLKAEAAVKTAEGVKAATILQGEGAKAATILQGQGEKEAIISRGQGEAQARRDIFVAIGEKPGQELYEMLLTLREMSKGNASTIFIPSEVTEALRGFGKVAGTGNIEKVLSKMGINEEMAKKIAQALKKEEGRK